jgi:hypothetical protein
VFVAFSLGVNENMDSDLEVDTFTPFGLTEASKIKILYLDALKAKFRTQIIQVIDLMIFR